MFVRLSTAGQDFARSNPPKAMLYSGFQASSYSANCSAKRLSHSQWFRRQEFGFFDLAKVRTSTRMVISPPNSDFTKIIAKSVPYWDIANIFFQLLDRFFLCICMEPILDSQRDLYRYTVDSCGIFCKSRIFISTGSSLVRTGSKKWKIIVFDKIECYQVCAIASFSISTENLVRPIRKAIAAILEKFIKAWVTKKSVLEISFMLRSRKSSRKSALLFGTITKYTLYNIDYILYKDTHIWRYIIIFISTSTRLATDCWTPGAFGPAFILPKAPEAPLWKPLANLKWL